MGKICQKSQNENQELKGRNTQSQYIISKFTLQEDVFQVYEIKEIPLGAGSFGTVRLATHKNSNNHQDQIQYAIKSINKRKVHSLEELKQEVDILITVDHPNIIKFFETYEDKQYFHIVMQLCTGGELFDYITEHGALSEKKAAQFMHQMMSAVNYLHQIDICHRDLKPENFLFESKEEDAQLCLIDFGLSAKFGKEKVMKSRVGTPYYVAPEILQGRQYGPECDI